MAEEGPRPKIFTDVLDRRASQWPQCTAFMVADIAGGFEPCTYSQLRSWALGLALRLAPLAPPGARVLLVADSSIEHVAGILACMYAGLVPVSGVPPHAAHRSGTSGRRNRSRQRLLAVLRDSGATAVLASPSLVPALSGVVSDLAPGTDLAWASLDRDTAPAVGMPVDRRAQPTALLQYTSGSTGAPRGVAVSHENLLRNLRDKAVALGLGQGDIGVSWLPFHHDMGLIGSGLCPLATGFPCFLMSPGHFAERPIRWLQAMSDARATVSWAPDFAYRLAADRTSPEDRRRLELGAWRVAVTAAEPVSWTTIEAFSAAFADSGFSRDAFMPCYGLAEATLYVSGGRSSTPPRRLVVDRRRLALGRAEPADETAGAGQTSIVSCGRPAAGTRVAIVDPARLQPATADGIGEIWIQGAGVTMGYAAEQGAARQRFEAKLPGDAGDWLRTGDLGFLHQGELFISGRLKDTIIVRGMNFPAEEIEAVVQRSHAQLVPGAGVAVRWREDDQEGFALVCEADRSLRRGHTQVFAAILKAVALEFDITPSRIALVPPASVPKTPSGKIQRFACEAMLLEGEFSPLASWARRPAGGLPPGAAPASEAELRTLIVDLLEQFAGARVGADEPLSECGIDSLGLVQFAVDLKIALDLPIRSAEVFERQTITRIADYVWTLARHTSEAAPPGRPPQRSAAEGWRKLARHRAGRVDETPPR